MAGGEGTPTPTPTEKEIIRAQRELLAARESPSDSSSSSPETSTAPNENSYDAVAFPEAQAYPSLPPYPGVLLRPQQRQQEEEQHQPTPQPQEYPGLPRLDYRLYSPPLFELSSDCTTIKSTAPYLSSTVEALTALVRAQVTVPPKPQVHITGKRGSKIDFAIKLNLLPLLVPEGGTEDRRTPRSYIRCVGSGESALRGGTKPDLLPDLGDHPSLEVWARRFINDPNQVKAFVLERVVTNLDTNWLSSQIRILVNSLNCTVSLPIGHHDLKPNQTRLFRMVLDRASSYD